MAFANGPRLREDAGFIARRILHTPPSGLPTISVPPLPAEIDQSPECHLLRRLRATPDLLARVVAGRGGATELAWQKTLRRDFSDDLVRAAIGLVELRLRATAKFSRAAEMWFDRQGLEQSTSELVARHKARRFTAPVTDLCCGIGSDAIALAAGQPVTAVDLNPETLLRMAWNAEIHGVRERITPVCADILSLTDLAGLVHIDPDRRPGSAGRVSRIEDYVPPLEWLQTLRDRVEGGAIKVGPASNFGGKFPDAEVELISLHGECKEATIWFGSLASSAPFRATVLPAGATLAGHPLDAAAPRSGTLQYVYDPDPAVVRAGMVDLCAEQLGLSRLDDAEEYLTSAEPVDSPFVHRFEVLADLPNNDRDLRAFLRSMRVASVEIKCRHIPVQAEALRRKLPLVPKGESLAVIFARVAGKARILVARRQS